MVKASDNVQPLKEWRISKFLTYRKLASMADVSTNTLYRAEKGEELQEITRRKIAKALRLHVSQIAEFASPPTEDQP